MGDKSLSITPLNAWHHANGGKMMDFEGWELPIQYPEGILAEHLATRRFGGMWDVSHMGRVRVGGEDRIAFLQHVLANNAEALTPWQAQYTLIPNERGGVIDDAYLYRFDQNDWILVVNASNREKDLAHLRRHAARFGDVTLEDITGSLAMIAFQGPLTGEVLEGLVEDGHLPEPKRNSLSRVTILGVETLIGRTGYTGEPIAFELLIPAEHSAEVWTAMAEAGAPHGIVPCGLGARDTLRLEAGLPLYGHEFGEDPDGDEFPAYSFPLSGLAVSFSDRKGDFVGRDALYGQFEQLLLIKTGDYEQSAVLPRRTRCLALLDKGVIRQGHEVFVGDCNVGFVTSGTVAPYWEFKGEGATREITGLTKRRPVALACMDATMLPDDEVEVDVRGKRLRAQLVKYHGRGRTPPYFRAIPVDQEEPVVDSKLEQGIDRASTILGKAVANHDWRQHKTINLIPSEMTQSPLVRLLQVSDPVQ